MYKPYSESYLMSMSKKELIEIIRILEHNCKVKEECNDRQYTMLCESFDKETQIIELITKLSIYAEQNKTLTAKDVFDWLEDIYPQWNEGE